MNIADARKNGYEIMRGAYAGTVHDNRNLWYIVKSGELCQKIKGYPTRRDALSQLAHQLEEIRFLGELESTLQHILSSHQIARARQLLSKSIR